MFKRYFIIICVLILGFLFMATWQGSNPQWNDENVAIGSGSSSHYDAVTALTLNPLSSSNNYPRLDMVMLDSDRPGELRWLDENKRIQHRIRHNQSTGVLIIEPGVNPDAADQTVAVNGLLCAKEVRVRLTGSPCWADYVFQDNYELRTIEELENFIKKNGHLPDIPTEDDIAKNGVSLGEMNKLLLKKVEELSLYIIDMKKEIEILKNNK